MKPVEYEKVSENVHIFCIDTDRYKTSYEITLSAGGAYFEKEGESGVAHLLEHCTVARSKNMGFNELKSFLFENNIDRGASTGILFLNFSTIGHYTDSDVMLDLTSEFAFHPTLTEEILNQERQIVLREVDQRSGDPMYRLKKLVMNSILEPGSMYLYDPLGKKEDIINSSIETLERVYKRILSQSQIIISAAGRDLSVKKIKNKIEKYLPQITSNNAIPIDFIPDSKSKDFKFMPIVSELAHDNVILDLLISLPIDYEHRHLRSFMQDLIFDYPTGILYDRLRNQLGLVYALYYDFNMSGNMLDIQVVCDFSNVQKIIDEVKSIFSHPEKIFTDEIIEVVKNLTIKRRELSEDDPGNVINYTLDNFLNWGKITNYDDYTEIIRNTKKQDLLDYFSVLQKNMKDMKVLVVSNQREIENLKPKF